MVLVRILFGVILAMLRAATAAFGFLFASLFRVGLVMVVIGVVVLLASSALGFDIFRRR